MGIRVDTSAIRRLRELSKRLKGVDKFLNKEAQLLSKLVNDSFQSSTSPQGEKFPKLKAKRVRGRKPLLKTGNMQFSFSATPEPPNTITLSFAAPYAKFHVYGTSKMPQRNTLPVEVLGPGQFAQSERGKSGFHWMQFADRLRLFILEGLTGSRGRR